MIALGTRAASVGLRVAGPLILLAVSGEAELGRFYLLTALILLLTSLGGVEASLYFGRAIQRSRGEALRTRLLWIGFLRTTLSFAALCAAVGSTYLLHKFGLGRALYPLVFLYIITETLINETVRLLWISGRGVEASLSDFGRSLIFMLSALAAAVIAGSVLSPAFFVLMALGNSALLLALKLPVSAIFQLGVPFRQAFGKIAIRGRRCLAYSLPQFGYLQAGGVWLFVERVVLERGMGVEAVAGYALIGSLNIAAASILAVPYTMGLRATFLSRVRPVRSDRERLYWGALFVIAPTVIVTTLIGLAGLPVLNFVLHKQLEVTPALAATAMVSGAAAMLGAQVGISFSRPVTISLALACCALTLSLLVVPTPLIVEFGLAMLLAHAIGQLLLRYAALRWSR